MHTVPTHLKGASLGEAHKWVREQMVLSNPSKPRADYTLSNESGSSVNLSDLTSGKASHITINAAGGVRNNPASPAELHGFMEIPAPMHANRLTALTQDQITPALWHSMVNQHGLFAATQTLSILLTRPISPSLRHSTKTMNLIRARKGETLLPFHRFANGPYSKKAEKPSSQGKSGNNSGRGDRNSRGRKSNPRPNPTPAETLSASTALGLGGIQAASSTMQRAGILNLDNDRMTGDIRREVDRVLDGAEVGMVDNEHGALVSMANKMSLQYENSRVIFDNFAQNVLAPYLITSTSNLNALKYINEYILPKMREIIMDKRGGDKKLRKLDRQYKHIVDKLATDPKDFYMGSEFALVAHPGFLFPRSGLVLMPIPDSTRDMAFRAFEQAGTPPTYDPGTGFVATSGSSDNTGVSYIGRETYQNLGRATFNQRRNWNNVASVIDSLINVVERAGETDSSGFNVIVRGAQSMAALGGQQLHERIAGTPAFYFVDLPGMRPIPTNWPQGLVMAMMEILAKGRDRITGLDGAFDADAFLTPSGINLGSSGAAFSVTDNGSVEYETVAEWRAARAAAVIEWGVAQALPPGPPRTTRIRAARNTFTQLVDSLLRAVRSSDLPFDLAGNALDFHPQTGVVNDGAGGTTPWPSANAYLENMLGRDITNAMVQVGGHWQVGHTIQTHQMFTVGARLADLDAWLDNNLIGGLLQPPTLPITTQNNGVSPSAYQIMVDSVELSMKKYNYEPTKDDIYFTMILLYYSLRHMNLDAEITGFLSGVGSIIEQARNASLNRFRQHLNTRFPVVPAAAAGPLSPNMINNWLALQFAYDAFNDPTSESFRELTGVRVNPGVRSNPVVTDNGIGQMKEAIKQSLDSYTAAIKATGNNTQSSAIVDALRDTVMPGLLKQMQTGVAKPLFVYAGDTDTVEEKLMETVDALYKQCYDAVEHHIETVTKLADIVSGNVAPVVDIETDIIQHLTEVKGTTISLEMLDQSATMMDDFVKFMPKGTSNSEKKYVSQMKNFMTIISDDLVFTTERVADLTEAMKKDWNGANPVATGVIHDLIEEVTQLRDIVDAYDTSLDEFGNYAMSTANPTANYPNAIIPVTGTPSAMKNKLIAAHQALLITVYGIPSIYSTYIDTYAQTKADIPIGPNANYFDDHMYNAKMSNPSINGLYLKVGPFNATTYETYFERSPRQGHDVFQFVKKHLDSLGLVNQETTVDYRFRTEAEDLVDIEYRKYEGKAKRGEWVIRGKAAAVATGKGLMMATESTLKAAGAAAATVIAAPLTGATLAATSIVTTGQVAFEALNQSTQTLITAMKTAGEETRDRLRRRSHRINAEVQADIAVLKADLIELKDKVAAGTILTKVQLTEAIKRGTTHARFKTYDLLAAYEAETAFGAFESGAIAIGTMLSSFDLANERRRTQRDINNNTAQIKDNIVQLGKLKDAYEQFPASQVPHLAAAAAMQTDILAEMIKQSEGQLFLLKEMEGNMPNSVSDELKTGFIALQQMYLEGEDKFVKSVKGGAAMFKAATATTVEIAADIITGAVVLTAKTAAKVVVGTAKTALAVTPIGFGMSILKGEREAQAAEKVRLEGEAAKNRLLGLE